MDKKAPAPCLPTIEDQKDDTIVVTVPAESHIYNVLQGISAVSKKNSPNYYVPKNLKEAIKKQPDCQDLDLSNDRFNKDDTEGSKRRRSTRL